MKGRGGFTVFIFLLFTSCSKQDIQVHSLERTSSLSETETKPRVYSTAWESIPAWSVETAPEAMSFSYTRSVPELSNEVLNNGVVLVFARNLWEEKEELKKLAMPDRPLLMPFYFLPYFEKPGYTEQWTYSARENQINISLVVKGGDDKTASPAKKIQLRYVIIPEEVLKQKNQSVQAVRKLSYEELVQNFSLGS